MAFDNAAPNRKAEGGYTGNSCSSCHAESTVFTANGGTNLTPATATSAGGDQVVLNFTFGPARTAMGTTSTTVQAPTVLPPVYTVGEYQVTSTGSAGCRLSGSAAGTATPVDINLAMPTTEALTCEFNASLTNTVTSDSLQTLPTTRQGTEAETPGVAAPTPVPVVGAAGAASPGVLGLAALLGYRRRPKNPQL